MDPVEVTGGLERIAAGLDVSALTAQLAAHPELWDAHTVRKTAPGTPHAAMSDIWVRYRDLSELISPQTYGERFDLQFYPAWGLLPALKPLTFALMGFVEATQLGGILITRIPPGGRIEPHHDRGSWHAERMNAKLYVPLQSEPGCINTCEDQAVHMAVGEVWTFDNLRVHSVVNDSPADRITVIISMSTK